MAIGGPPNKKEKGKPQTKKNATPVRDGISN
jgi:hypothetical protein